MSAFPARKPAIIIAEIGVNHNGDTEIAKELIRVAKHAGADYAKFQTFSSEDLVTADAEVARYQEPAAQGMSQQALLRGLELSQDEFISLRSFCDDTGIGFLTTAHDFASLGFVLGLGLDFIKVASGDLTNRPFLERIAQENTEILLSTGMGHFDEVVHAVEVLEDAGLPREKVVVLQCTTNYPAPLEEANLLAMVAMAEQLAIRVGYSDHTTGNEASLAAVALGAEVIEKHLTLDRAMQGPDHPASEEPEGFAHLVGAIRCVEKALGSAEKSPTPSETPNRDVVRKSLVALRPIAPGDEFSPENVGVMRPGTGISPMRWHDVMGLRSSRQFSANEMIEIP